MEVTDKKLTEKQKRFIDAYLECANAAEAARKAGYKQANCDQIGAQNLRKLPIKIEIQKRAKELENSRIMSAQEVLERLTACARGESEGEEIAVVGIGGGMSEVQLVKKKPSHKDKNDALKMLAKRYRLLADNVQIGGEVQVVFTGSDALTD